MPSTTTLWYSTTTTTTACPCTEQWESREKTHSTDGWQGQRVFVCTGGTGMISPEDCCPVDLYDAFPGGPLTLLARKIHWERISGGATHSEDAVKMTVEYSTEKNTSQTIQEFDVSGSSVAIHYEILTTSAPGVGKLPRQLPKPEGADVLKPEEIYKVTQHLAAFPAAQVMSNVGKTNEKNWGAYSPMTWLFLGAQGRRTGLGSWEVTYLFQYKEETWKYREPDQSHNKKVTIAPFIIFDTFDFPDLPGNVAP